MIARTMRLRGGYRGQLGVVLLCALALSGCHGLSRFDTTDGDAYCGSIVTAPFIRDAIYPPNMRMQLHLDISSLTTLPGDISTDDALCSPAPMFQSAQLRALNEVQSDPLSLMQFGEDREDNFFAWVDTDCQGTVLTVVSLMKNNDVEVRLLEPEPAPPPGTKPHSGFAVFQLTRHKGDCGF